MRFAIQRFAGGVIMVSNNEELCGMATERWFMDLGSLHVEHLKEGLRSQVLAVAMPGEPGIRASDRTYYNKNNRYIYNI